MIASAWSVTLPFPLCHPVSWTVTPHSTPSPEVTLSFMSLAGGAVEHLGMPALSLCPGDPDNTVVLHGPRGAADLSQDPRQSEQRGLLEILRVRLYVDLDVSEDEHLRSGESVRGVSGTSLAVCTESPSLSLLRLANL